MIQEVWFNSTMRKLPVYAIRSEWVKLFPDVPGHWKLVGYVVVDGNVLEVINHGDLWHFVGGETRPPSFMEA